MYAFHKTKRTFVKITTKPLEIVQNEGCDVPKTPFNSKKTIKWNLSSCIKFFLNSLDLRRLTSSNHLFFSF